MLVLVWLKSYQQIHTGFSARAFSDLALAHWIVFSCGKENPSYQGRGGLVKAKSKTREDCEKLSKAKGKGGLRACPAAGTRDARDEREPEGARRAGEEGTGLARHPPRLRDSRPDPVLVGYHDVDKIRRLSELGRSR